MKYYIFYIAGGLVIDMDSFDDEEARNIQYMKSEKTFELFRDGRRITTIQKFHTID